MHFYLPKTVAAILAFTVWSNTFVSGCFSEVSDVSRSATPVNNDLELQVPPGWRKIDAEGKFSFYLPPDMHMSGTGIENLHREYTNGRINVNFDYEPFGFLGYEKRELAFGKGFQETELQVDGRKAYLFLYQSLDFRKRRIYQADLFVGDLPNHEVLLHMWIICWSQRRIETAKTIFGTIKFSARGTRS